MTDQGPSIAERYHDATKYSPEGIAASRHELDWDAKPAVFKDYEGAPRVGLMPPLLGRSQGPVTLEDLTKAVVVPEAGRGVLGLEDLARLLFLTNGVTRVVLQPSPTGEPDPFFMRAAPSAGGLYPTEVYVVAGAAAGVLPPGVWNLNVRDLALARVKGGTPAEGALERLATATAVPELVRKAAIAVVLTGVFQRSGWRYQERAYRRVLLDTGHVLGNLVHAAGLMGFTALPIAGFADEEVERMLGLDSTDEGALLVVPILPASATEVLPPRGALALKGPVVHATPAAEAELGLMRALHLATRLVPPLERAFGRDAPGDAFLDEAMGPPLALPEPPIDWSGGHLERTILGRRSTRAFDQGEFSLAEVGGLLADAYGPAPTRRVPAGVPVPQFIDASLLETFVVLSRPTDAPAGVYRFDPRERTLRLIVPGPRTRECHALCLGQELGRDAAAVVLHTVDFPRAIARYGDRAYRYAHLDAGHLGERLDLAALRLGLGASGIGGFFDDQANALLGLPLRQAIVYITTLGRPREGSDEE